MIRKSGRDPAAGAGSGALGQDPVVADRNRLFFAENQDYARKIAQLDTYRRIRDAVNEEIRGLKRLLDVGNGGVFDYDTALVTEIVAVDLFLDELPRSFFPENVTPRRGDALQLPEPEEMYDGVLISSVFHHLVGETWRQVVPNTRQALREAHRVLRPGGRLIIVESCVPRWFFEVEKRAFKPARALLRLPALRRSHPVTLQLPVEALLKLVRERFRVERMEPIRGRWILQFGKRWPTLLTPATPHLILAKK